MSGGLLANGRRDVGRFAARLPNVAGTLPATLLRYARLHLARHGSPARSARAERVVVTLTTTPARASRLKPVLNSLLDQSEPADRILLALPEFSRDGRRYPDPADLGLPAGIEVLRCKDEGPATKLLPALKAEPDSALVVVDDDVVYPRRFIEFLLDGHRERPLAALGLRGVRVRHGLEFKDLEHVFATGISKPCQVDVLFGTWGYLVPPGILAPAVHDFSGAPAALRWVDDIWISGHLARAGVDRFVVAASELPLETLSAAVGSLTGGVNRDGLNDRTGLDYFAAEW